MICAKEAFRPPENVILQPDKWVERYAGHFYNYALPKVNDAELARDLVQETFLTALECCHKFEYRSSERSWLTGILKIKIYNIYKQRLKNTHVVTDFQKAESDDFFEDKSIRMYLINAEVATVDPMVNKEFFDFIKCCVDKWPKLWQTLFLMKYIELKNTVEICDKLKLSPTYYWVICHRIKASLRISLENFWL
jgi:RNA polymerase sigma factor (sigma-70 family)